MLSTVLFNQQAITPSKIVCVGRNYVEHIEELNNAMPEQMVLFNKPNSAISDVLFAHHSEPLHYEAELCFLVQNGRYTGVGVGLDLTKRELQSTLKSQGLPWERAKAFDGSACFSSFVAMPDSLDQLRFTLHINGELQQQGSLDLMIYQPPTILSDISGFCTLQDGDIVMTGTPKGVGKVTAGASYHVSLFLGSSLLVEHRWIAVAGM